MEQNQILNDIAIISMSGRFPRARNVQEFWHNLKEGVESISFFTDQELLAEGVTPTTLKHPDYVKAGAVLDGVDTFDAAFFDISPHDAALMDPQQRFFLECAWEALEEAGYDTQRSELRIGVFAGAGMNTYLLHNIASDRALLEREGGFNIGLGNEKDYLATRIAYKLNLKGPSISIGTACSTSLVAVHLGVQSLLNHECDMALAGGVAIQFPHGIGYRHQEGGITSSDGHSRVFDKDAQGTIRSSGAGVVLLKRLADALDDGDRVLAVIKGSAVNNDGSDKIGYTAPSVSGQSAVIVEAQEVAGVNPEMIDYIEAHGTATRLGDPIEVMALTHAFRRSTKLRQYCALGSVKSNIGHLDVAAGIAGLIKVVLSLQHQQIPPSLHFVESNPEIPFAESPFFVNKQLRDWERKGHLRTAGVSSFGIGGTNAHVIVQEAPIHIQVAREELSRPGYLLPLSAKTVTALEQMNHNLAAHLEQNGDVSMSDVAATLQLGRRQFEQRSFVVCREREDAIRVLREGRSERRMSGAAGMNVPDVAFLFPGQGSQHIHMAAELYQHEPVFRTQLDRCVEFALPLLKCDIRPILYPITPDIEQAAERLTQTQLAQPALFMIEYALAQQWMAWGIKPTALLGHSVGEYVAACLAGVFSLEDALSLIIERGRLIQSMPRGSMLAVPLPQSDILSLIKAYPLLSLAAINTPGRCVVSGPSEEIERFIKQLDEQNIMTRLLHTSHAFHSSMMEPIVPSFTQQVQQVARHKPAIPFLSNLTGTWITDEDAIDPQYWAKHLRQPVNFAEDVQTLLAWPELLAIEVGPGTSLSSLLKQHPAYGSGHLVLSSLAHTKDNQGDLAALLRAAGQCWLQGQAIEWSHFFSSKWQKVPLPGYPFERKKHWIAPQKATIAQTPPTVQYGMASLPIVQTVALSAHENGNGHRHNSRPVAKVGAGDGIAEIFAQQLQVIEQQIALLDENESGYNERNKRR